MPKCLANNGRHDEVEGIRGAGLFYRGLHDGALQRAKIPALHFVGVVCLDGSQAWNPDLRPIKEGQNIRGVPDSISEPFCQTAHSKRDIRVELPKFCFSGEISFDESPRASVLLFRGERNRLGRHCLYNTTRDSNCAREAEPLFPLCSSIPRFLRPLFAFAVMLLGSDHLLRRNLDTFLERLVSHICRMHEVVRKTHICNLCCNL